MKEQEESLFPSEVASAPELAELKGCTVSGIHDRIKRYNIEPWYEFKRIRLYKIGEVLDEKEVQE